MTKMKRILIYALVLTLLCCNLYLPSGAVYAEEPAPDSEMINIAPEAAVETDIERDPAEDRFSLLDNINDENKEWWIWVTAPNTPYEGKYIQFTFAQQYEIGSVAISADEGLGAIQGVKNIDIQARVDGEWQTVIEDYELEWQLNSTVNPADKKEETLTVALPQAVVADGIKVIINEIVDANLEGKYRIAEVEIFGKTPDVEEPPELDPEMVNIAPDAAVETDIERDTSDDRFSLLKNINDGDVDWWIWATAANTPYEGKYIQFTFTEEATVGAVSFVTDEGLGTLQGIKNVDIQVRVDGEWQTVAENQELKWTLDSINNPATDKRAETITLPLPEAVVTDGIKVIINGIVDANLEGKYRIAEIEILGKYNGEPTDPPADPNDPNIAASAVITTNITERDQSETRYYLDGNLTDGDYDWTMWLTPIWEPESTEYIGKYIQFDFGTETTVSKFSISSGKDGLGLIQGVKDISIYFAEETEGEPEWKPIMENLILKWPDTGIDTLTFLLDHPVPLCSIKFVINDIYRLYENRFRISEIEIFGKSTDYAGRVDELENQKNPTAEDYFEVYDEISNLQDSALRQNLLERLEQIAEEMESRFAFEAQTDNYLRTIHITGGTIQKAGQEVAVQISGPAGFAAEEVQTTAAASGVIDMTYQLPEGAPYGTYTINLLDKQLTVAYAVPNDEKDIKEFLLEGTEASIRGSEIAVTLPYGSDLKHAIAAYTLSDGASLYLGDVLQESGKTVNDYTAPVRFTVVAEDRTEKYYTVTASVASRSGGGGGGSNGGGRGGSGGRGGMSSYTVDNSSPTPTPTPEPSAEPVQQPDYIGHWSEGLFRTLIQQGVIAPDENGDVAPDRAITREEMTKMLVLILGYDTNAEAAKFSDMEDGAWYTPYIAAAVSNGLVQGIGDNLFGIGSNILRQDAAVLCYRTLGETGQTASAPITDAEQVSGYAKEAVDTLYEMGLLQGDGDGRFRPLDSLSRAEAAALLTRLAEVKK